MEVHGKIDEADIGHVKVGQQASFTVDAYPDRVFSGTVLQIRKSPEVVQNVVTYTVIVSALNPDLLLLPGMTAQLQIVVTDTGDVLKIPNQALRFQPNENASGRAQNRIQDAGASATSARVWVVGENGRPLLVKVRTGINDDNSTQLLDGRLADGQQLIVGVSPPRERRGFLDIRLGF
jgi:HlyD family secretion protein